MKNKYYTPTIEEFHVGFECEFKNKMQSNEWEHNVCDTDLISIAFDSHEHEDIDDKFEDNFRVKYLDKEDIESFGFSQITDECFNLNFENYRGRDKQEIRILIRETVLIYLAQDEKYNDTNTTTLFTGRIKNKSELKKLLTQLEIL